MNYFVLRETLKVVDDDSDVGTIESEEYGGLVQLVPRLSGVMARHGMKCSA